MGSGPWEAQPSRHHPAPAQLTGSLPHFCSLSGETTKAVERSHVPTRDRLRNSRGLKRTETEQRSLEVFEALRHLRRSGMPRVGHLVRGPAPHVRVRQVVVVVAAIHTLGHELRRRP